jgi:hypothetical protein
MKKRAGSALVSQVENIRPILMRAVEDIVMALGLWKSEMDVRGRLVDEKTDFLVETIRGMCEVIILI